MVLSINTNAQSLIARDAFDFNNSKIDRSEMSLASGLVLKKVKNKKASEMPSIRSINSNLDTAEIRKKGYLPKLVLSLLP